MSLSVQGSESDIAGVVVDGRSSTSGFVARMAATFAGYLRG
jgi:hypothetical protein